MGLFADELEGQEDCAGGKGNRKRLRLIYATNAIESLDFSRSTPTEQSQQDGGPLNSGRLPGSGATRRRTRAHSVVNA